MSETDKIIQLRQETGEVKELLCQNVEKLTQRQENLEDLSDRTQILEESSRNFVIVTTTLQRKYWWRNFWMWLMLWIILIVIFGCLIAWLVANEKEDD
ncbi:vesicle-associated membrane protein 8-like [Dysidea avara]|uniref:vesicle-associated membrane protein 8-like n=1 Tax=Dysidea avara TaxID=196820 RepID=UPI0033255404